MQIHTQITITKSDAIDLISPSQFKLNLFANAYTDDAKTKEPKGKILSPIKKSIKTAKVIVTRKGKYTNI